MDGTNPNGGAGFPFPPSMMNDADDEDCCIM